MSGFAYFNRQGDDAFAYFERQGREALHTWVGRCMKLCILREPGVRNFAYLERQVFETSHICRGRNGVKLVFTNRKK